MILRIGWSCVIFLVMFVPLPGGDPHWFGRLDLLVHFGFFAVLGGLNRDLLTRGLDRPAAVRRLLLLFSVILLPELIQTGVPTRGFDVFDLTANTTGTAWGLTVGALFPYLTYLVAAGGLMGLSGGLTVLREVSYGILFEPIFSGTLTVALALPLIPVMGWLYRRNGRALALVGVVYVFFLMQVKTAVPGPGVLLGGLSLSTVLAVRQLEANAVTVSLETVGLTGFVLFVLENELGLATFLAGGGFLVVGVVPLVTLLQLVLLRPVPTVRFRPQFREATRS